MRVVSNMVGEPDANPMHVPESIIQDVWDKQRFTQDNLTTTAGANVRIVDQGKLNRDQGPDFVDATILIDDVKWSGAVEIHRCSGDWFRHGHQTDPIYNNVILHASLIADRSTGMLIRHDGTIIPEILLFPRLDSSLRTLSWDASRSRIREFPCHRFWPTVPEPVVGRFLVDLANRRMHRKAERVIVPIEGGKGSRSTRL